MGDVIRDPKTRGIQIRAYTCTAWFLLTSKTTFFAPTLVFSHYITTHIQPIWRLKSTQRSFRARRPRARPCTSIVDVSHVHVQCSVSMPIPYTHVYAYANILLVHVHTYTYMQNHVEAARRHGKTFDIVCMRRSRGSVVLPPTTILALETARGLGR